MYTLASKIKVNSANISHRDFDNAHFSFDLKDDGKFIKGVLTAKTDMVMESFSVTKAMEFTDESLFFANGYQSWSTSKELGKGDNTKDIIPAARVLGGFAEFAAGEFADYNFKSYVKYGKRNCFRSYTYTYIRNKGDFSKITLYGSRSERKGFTVFECDMEKNLFTVRKDVEGLRLSAGQEYEMFDIAIIENEYEKAFDEYFFDFMGIKEPRIKHLAGYTSWYNYFSRINEEICLRDLDGMDRAKECVDIFQLDDGFQTATGDWLSVDKKKFPHGLKNLAQKIHAKGYLAGIWLAPFCAQITSQVAKDHPEWLIKDEKTGKTLLRHIGWGGAYALDIYHEGAREYIKHFFDVILNDWGFDLVKLDFLFTQCITPRYGKTRGEIMCDGVDLLREACGDKFILGCGVPLGACMGIFDACRISCDVNKMFEGNIVNMLGLNNEVPSAQGAINNTVFRRHLDGRAFCNDPDVLFLRKNNLKFTDEQKYLLGKINAICGNVLFVSDNAGAYDYKSLTLMKEFFTEKKYEVTFAEYVTPSIIKLDFTEDGVARSMNFDIKNGKTWGLV
ncbi:MAG: alpha-galactosidase [Ruminococcaceae bacterium]|nr:alpha-galactosidase [Oscillospiraceae bacterium]